MPLTIVFRVYVTNTTTPHYLQFRGAFFVVYSSIQMSFAWKRALHLPPHSRGWIGAVDMCISSFAKVGCKQVLKLHDVLMRFSAAS